MAMTSGFKNSISDTPPLDQVYLDKNGEPIEVGDIVTHIDGHSGNDPFPPDKEGIIMGLSTTVSGCIVINIEGHFGGGQHNWCNFRKDYTSYLKIIKKNKKVATKTNKIDETKLNKLILKEEIKQEILAVLKQHELSNKIFVEWGLGDTIEYGKGMSFLFYGTPGTGKTFAASCIAKALGTELLILSPAEIQTSEPGGANRNIKDAFTHAKSTGKVLLIDECDSLIFDRTTLGMVLGGEVNTLLTEIEQFEGILILTTNRISEMDAALERRISLIVEFEIPNKEERKNIWNSLIPDKFPLASDITLEKLSRIETTGGIIKNILLQAARLAVSENSPVVALKHFKAAHKRIKQSQSKMGKPSERMVRSGHSLVDTGVGKSKTTLDSFIKNDVDVTKDESTEL